MNTIELTNDRHHKQDFARMKSVLACASKDSTRLVITKVLVEKDPDGIKVIATDMGNTRPELHLHVLVGGTTFINIEPSPSVHSI